MFSDTLKHSEDVTLLCNADKYDALHVDGSTCITMHGIVLHDDAIGRRF